jgi:hypothetical protein
MHMPMHLGDNKDKGGNNTQVRLVDRGTNMQRPWNTNFPGIRRVYHRFSAVAELNSLMCIGSHFSSRSAETRVSERLALIDSDAGRRRVVEYLESRPFPHYQPIPSSPGFLVRIDGDGTRTVGRFVGREFQAVPCP